MLNLNLSLVEELEPVPTGDYEVTVSSMTLGKREIKDPEDDSKKITVDNINVTYVITEGEHKGNKILDNFLVTESALFRLANFIKVFDPDIDMEDSNYQFNVADYNNQSLIIKVQLTTYKDSSGEEKPANRVKGFYPLA